MTQIIVPVFVIVYVGMFLGWLPRIQLDRTGVALLGAIALVATRAVTIDSAGRAIDEETIALLFAFMVISAQLRLGGFYTRVIQRVTALPVSERSLLGIVICATAVLAAVFTNDVVCLAATPVLIQACDRRGLDPVPFLLALACAANIGSAWTLIGNPQNILIGESLDLSFGGYSLLATVPVIAGLAVVWLVIVPQYRSRWTRSDTDRRLSEAPRPTVRLPAWNPWQATKGITVTALLFLAFLVAPWPRAALALGGAALLLTSRRFHSRDMLGLVDWQLLVLFAGLFVVNHALQATGIPERLVAEVASRGLDLTHPAALFAQTVVLSNAVSNVPAVMLLLPLADHPLAGPLLAVVSTFAGNLLIVGSIANIIVVDIAAAHGIVIDWRTHARTGAVVAGITLVVAGAVFWIVARASGL